LQRAEQIARYYRIVLEYDDDAGWVGSGVELPTVFGGGKTPDECVKDTRAALVVAVAHMLERGQHPPESSARTLQVNIRLTPEEKLVLTNTARRVGFQGLSDFLRSIALQRAERS
jgi:predicted RNase H-like HicB family nuclease